MRNFRRCTPPDGVVLLRHVGAAYRRRASPRGVRVTDELLALLDGQQLDGRFVQAERYLSPALPRQPQQRLLDVPKSLPLRAAIVVGGRKGVRHHVMER